MADTSDAPIGGIVLCGGKSRRMGRAKASLPFGKETMLERVVRLLHPVVSELVVVAARDQQLPPLDAAIRVVRDRRDDRGPLEGLAAGLAGLSATCEAAYVTSCDAPLLVPAFATRMAWSLGDHDVAVPRIDGRWHPLAAVYRRRLLPEIERRVAAGQLRMLDLFDVVRTRVVGEDELREVDATLATLQNVNSPADYAAALTAAAVPSVSEILQRLDLHSGHDSPGGA